VEQLLSSLDNERATAALYLALSYLDSREIVAVPAGLLSSLAVSQKIAGASERKILHGLVDKFLIGGRPFSWWFSSSHLFKNLTTPRPFFLKILSLPWNIAFPHGYSDVFRIRRHSRRRKRRFHGGV
jgi:hypothetical protein